jgi:DNA polymerase
VKHFKFTPRGKRRIHSKPTAGEVKQCAWWLGAEIEDLRPDLIVALGPTALYALVGQTVSLTEERGRILKAANGSPLLVTVHPSYLLRVRGHEDREVQRSRFVRDLKANGSYL